MRAKLRTVISKGSVDFTLPRCFVYSIVNRRRNHRSYKCWAVECSAKKNGRSTITNFLSPPTVRLARLRVRQLMRLCGGTRDGLSSSTVSEKWHTPNRKHTVSATHMHSADIANPAPIDSSPAPMFWCSEWKTLITTISSSVSSADMIRRPYLLGVSDGRVSQGA